MIQPAALVRQAWRRLRRRPRLAAVAVLTLALPMAFDLATFSIVDAVVLRPLPLHAPDRLVRIRQTNGDGASATALSVDWNVYRRWRAESRSFTGIAAATGAAPTLTGAGEPVRVPTARVSANFFGLLGIQPVLGRDFRADEDGASATPVVIVGDTFWRARLGASPAALGRTLDLDGVPHVVVGVLPPRFRHPYDADLFVPLRPSAGEELYLYCPARLRLGVRPRQAQRELTALAARMNDLPPAIRPHGAALTSLRDELMGDLGSKVLALALAAGLVLLIAAANLAAVQVAMTRARRPELAVRLALGARRADVAAHALADSLLLTALATAIALPLAALVIRAVLRLAPFLQGDYASALNELDVSVRIGLSTVLYALAVALLVALLLGAASALQDRGRNLRAAIAAQRVRVGRSEARLLRLLVAAEIAAAVIVLAGAGLTLESFRRQWLGDPGYAARDLYVYEVDLPATRYRDAASVARFAREAAERLRAVPGVLSASATTVQPLDPGTTDAAANVAQRPAPDPPGYYFVNHRQVLPGYLETLGVRLLAGRTLAAGDDARGEPVVVVDRALAQRLWPRGSAVGQLVKRGRLDGPRPPMRVVGVVDVVRERRDPEVIGTWYVPVEQQPDMLSPELRLVARAPHAGRSALAAMTAAIRGSDAALAVGARGTLEALLRESLTEERFSALLVGTFGALALLLAAIGIYGLLAHWVGERTRELAVRAALGCSRGGLLARVLREASLLFAAGLALGIAGALALRRFAAALTESDVALDPRMAVAAVVVLAAVVFAAALLPARRAANASPVLALRGE